MRAETKGAVEEFHSAEVLGDSSRTELIDSAPEEPETPAFAAHTIRPLSELLKTKRNPLIAGRTLAAYELLEEVARGGQGIVVRARHIELGNAVALKLHDPEGHASDLERFRQEAQVLARLSHPHLPRVTDLGEDQGVAYLAMEWLEGRTIEALVRQDGLPEPRDCALMLEPIARALAYCHGEGVVHRDVKPLNILIETGTRRPVLIDFGLLKRVAKVDGFASVEALSISRSHEVKGSPEFMPPEQAEPDGTYGEIGPAADVHGLGGTLYFLLTGRPPFGGGTDESILEDVIRNPPIAPGRLNPAVPAALDELVTWALTKGQADRPAAEAFAAALGAFLSEGPTSPEVAPLVSIAPESSEVIGAPPRRRRGSSARVRNDLGRSGRRRQVMRRGRSGAMDGVISMESADELPLATSRRMAVRTELPVMVLAGGLVLLFVAVGVVTVTTGAIEGALTFGFGVAVLGVVTVVLARKVPSTPPRTRGLEVSGRRRAPTRPAPRPKPVVQEDPAQHAERGSAALRARDYVAAEAEFSALLDLRPEDPDAYANRGVARFRAGDLSGAEADFDAAVSLRGDDAEAHANRGKLRFKLGRVEEALADFSEAIRLRPEDADLLANRGACFYRKKDFAHALADFSECVRLASDDPEAYRRRGRAYFKAREYEQAVEDFSQVLRLRPDDLDAYKKRAASYHRLGDTTRAAADDARVGLMLSQAGADASDEA